MKEDTTPINPTWISKEGGYARDMTLRDYYAGVVVQALLSHPDCATVASPETFAKAACTMADAMLKAREGK